MSNPQRPFNISFATLICMLLFAGIQQASAYYDPGAQRWINRDPIEDKGHAVRRNYILVLHHAAKSYIYVDNAPIIKMDAEGLNPVAGCLGGGLLGGLGGAIGGIGAAFGTGCWKPVMCGAAGGAAAGCVQGAACTTPIPGLCVAGGCLGGALGSVVEQACNGSLDFRNPCTWITTFVNTAVGCLGGTAEATDSAKAKLVQFVLGVDVSAIGSLCQ